MSNLLKFIICPLGDKESVEFNKHEANVIRRGIVDAAKTTGAEIMCHSKDREGRMSKFMDDTIRFNPDMADGLEITYVDSLIDYLDQDKDRKTFVIFVVVGGDSAVLNFINQMCERNIDNWHIIVVEGSGRAADFLSYGYNLELDSSTSFELEAKYVFGVQFVGSDEHNANGNSQLWQSVTNKITLWSFEGVNGLVDVIENVLFAQLQGMKDSDIKQLSIKAVWNRYDLAERNISKNCYYQDMSKETLWERFKYGLVNNKVGLVRKLLRKYENFESSLNRTQLKEIYEESVKDYKKDRAADLFMNLLSPSKKDVSPGKDVNFFSKIGKFVEQLLADTHLNPYCQNNEQCSDVKKLCSKDLFCWALLLNKQDMATLFWTRGETYTCSALFASALLRKLSRRAKDFGDIHLSRAMKKNAMNFERYASVIVNKMHTTRSDISKNLIVSVVEEYGETTPLYIAGNNNLMDFMEETVCQEKLTDIWNGNISWNTSLVKKFGCIFLPFLLLSTIKFKSCGQDKLNSSGQGCQNEVQPIKTEKFRYFTVFSSKAEKRIGIFNAVHSFYSAPVIKFMTSASFYAVYLWTFSIMIITDLHDLEDGGLSSLELVVICWTGTFVLEEIRQIVEEDQPSYISRIKIWFSSAGNKFDTFAYLMLVVSIVARFSLPTNMFVWARYSYSITVIVYWWISMRFLFVHRHIGPKVVMIGKMLTDLVFLILIFVVVVISVGIAYNANIYPNSIFDWETVKKIVFYPYWQMHGELFLDYIRGNEPDPPGECTYDPVLFRNGTLPACPVKFDMVTMIAAVYLVLLNIILINVLIAMFSYTFLKVQSRAGKVARFHNYFLVYEYSNMPTMIAPFNLVNLLYRMCKSRCGGRDNKFKIKLEKEDQQEMAYYESEALETALLSTLVRNDTDQTTFKPRSKEKNVTDVML